MKNPDSLPAKSGFDPASDDPGLEWRQIYRWLRGNSPQVLAGLLLGFALTVVMSVLHGRNQPVETVLDVTFSYPGGEKGEYPDGTAFSPEDLRSAEGLAEGAKVLAPLGNPDLPAQIPRHLTVRSQAASPATTRHSVTLALPKKDALPMAARIQYLDALWRTFRARFADTYLNFPGRWTEKFNDLEKHDYANYPAILDRHFKLAETFIQNRIDQAKNSRALAAQATLQDCMLRLQNLEETDLSHIKTFIQATQPMKHSEYSIAVLNSRIALAEEKVRDAKASDALVSALLAEVTNRANLAAPLLEPAAPSGPERPGTAMLQQLLASDAYSALVKEALKTGLALQEQQAELNALLARRNLLLQPDPAQSADLAQNHRRLETMVADLERQYLGIMQDLRANYQRYDDTLLAAMLASNISTSETLPLNRLLKHGFVGGLVGAALAAGLALVGLSLGPRART